MSLHTRTYRFAGLLAVVAVAVAACSSSQSSGSGAPGVSAKTIKIGYVSDQTGRAASSNANAIKGFRARIDRQNADGGINGRKIEIVAKDDASDPAQYLTAAKTLVQQEKVFLVSTVSSVTYGGAPYLSQQKVPVVGAPFSGPEWGKYTNMFGVNGSPDPSHPSFTTFGTYFKQAGATKFASIGYGASPASAAGAKSIATSVRKAGIPVAYLNTSVQFGSSFQSEAIAIKNSGADAVFANLDTAAVIQLLTALKQNGVHLKASLFPTGYGQDLLDQPTALQAAQGASFAVLWKPAQVDDAATKQEVADLAKYAHYTGVPGFDYTYGYLTADLTITALRQGGKSLTRASVISGLRKVTSWTGDGLTAGPVSFAPSAFAKADAIQEGGNNCIYVATVQNKAFTVTDKPVCGTKIAG